MNTTITKRILFFSAFVILFGACQKETDNLLESSNTPPVVDAGVNQTVQLPAASITLTGTATTEAGTTIRAYLWSMVSGPNVPVITSPGSATTTVTNLTAGTYIFQLMATNSEGLTGVDTTKILVNASPIQTLTLQPANNPNERFILGNSSGFNSGDSPTEFSAVAWTIGGVPVTGRGLFRFDMSAIPAGATILTAKLSLYSNPTPLNGDLVNANSGTNNAFYIRRIISNWVPASTDWLGQPSTTTTDQVAIAHTTQSMLDLVDVDVKNLVTAMYSGSNYGFMINLQNETFYNMRNFCSSRYPNAAKYPKLVITYQP
jgi:hypothetical protein